ncbi:MAG: STAS domain-containing protein [Polyangia bacterium]|jgi:anti-anti-sigma regulatory factor
MVQFEKKKLNDGSLHVTITGKIDEKFDPAPVIEAATGSKVVIHLAGIRSISSLGVRAFEALVDALSSRDVVLIHVSPAIANQITMIPNLIEKATVESAKLPFICPACGAEKSHSIPWRAGAAVDHAPKCTCGATMDLDGMPEHYLPGPGSLS